MFSYKAQVDDAMDEDTVSLPHQQSFSSLKTDSDYIYQVHTPSIHMPLHNPQAPKSLVRRKGSSLYSLTTTKDPKHSALSAPHRLESGIRSFDTGLSTKKDTPKLANYPLRSVQTSAPDLRSNSNRQVTYDGFGSVSNLFFRSDTASKFLYKPIAIDSNVNLYAQTRKSSLESTVDETTENRAITSENIFQNYSSSSPEIFQVPLESSLQVILESGNYEIKTKDPQELRTSDVDTSIEENAGPKPSHLTTRSDAKMFKTCSDDTLSNVSHTSNVTHELLLKSIPSRTTDVYRKSKSYSKEGISSGLSDYLLAITKSRGKPEKRYETSSMSEAQQVLFPDSDPKSSRDSYKQTESQ